jgi:hypothetical protein
MLSVVPSINLLNIHPVTHAGRHIKIKSFEKLSSKLGTVKHGVPQGSILGNLLIYIYINDLNPTINTLSEPILFAEYTSVVISGKKFYDLSTISNTVLSHTGKWFTSNKFALNLNETNIIKFITNKLPQYDFKIRYDERYTEQSINTKFQGLQIDNHLHWNNDIALIIPKLSAAC